MTVFFGGTAEELQFSGAAASGVAEQGGGEHLS